MAIQMSVDAHRLIDVIKLEHVLFHEHIQSLEYRLTIE